MAEYIASGDLAPIRPQKQFLTSRHVIVLLLCLNGLQFLLFLKRIFYSTIQDDFVVSGETTLQKSTSHEWKPSPVVFGHLHLMKTAGTSINGVLASHFERVCGNKGYSYDAFEFNKRAKEINMTLNRIGFYPDIITRTYPEHHRGRVPKELTWEIGFQDCDWISLEDKADVWKNVAKQVGGSLELHVPCRDPIDHLLSKCNHVQRQFDCSGNLNEEIRRCKVTNVKYREKAFDANDGIRLKCFNPIPIDGYVNYMSSKLQRKRIENDYHHKETNLPRDKSSECLLSDIEVATKVREILVRKYDYYTFCEGCMGSSEELF